MQLTTQHAYTTLTKHTHNTCNSPHTHTTDSYSSRTTHATHIQHNIHLQHTQHTQLNATFTYPQHNIHIQYTHTTHTRNATHAQHNMHSQHTTLIQHTTRATHKHTYNTLIQHTTLTQHTHNTCNSYTTYTYTQHITFIQHTKHTTHKYMYNTLIQHTTLKYTINATQHNMHIQHTYNPCNSHTTQHTHTTHSYNTHCIDSKYEIENSTRTVSKVWWVFSRRSSNIQTGTMSSFSAAVQIQAFLSSALWIIIIQHKPIFHFTPTLVWGDTHSLICRALLQLLHTEPGLERGWWGYRHGKLKRNWQVEKDRPKSKEKCWTLSTNSSHDRWHSGYWKFIERDIAPKKKFSPKVMEDSQQTPAPNTPSAEGLWVKKKVRRK